MHVRYNNNIQCNLIIKSLKFIYNKKIQRKFEMFFNNYEICLILNRSGYTVFSVSCNFLMAKK